MDNDALSGIIFQLVVLGVLVTLSAYFSATETAFFSVNKIRLKAMANDGNKRAKLVLKICDDLDSFLSATLIGNNLVNIATTAIATVLLVSVLGQELGATVSTVAVTVVVLICGEITPKSLAKNSPEGFAMFSAPIIHILMIIFKPLTWLISCWQNLIYRFIKKDDVHGITEEELITMVEEAHHDGEIDHDESELIRNAIEFNDIEVEDIYTSRVDLVAVDIEDDNETISNKFKSGFSRLPVYKDTIDNIVGILNQKDFDEMLKSGGSVADVMSDPIFIVPTMKISELLRTLQSKKSHMAIILDEYGGTVGIVTLEDIIEELVGEIWDEHDKVFVPFEKIADNKYKVNGKADLESMFELFDIDAESDHSTVGGWIAERFGRIPQAGEETDFETLHISVSKRDPRRVIEAVITKTQN